MRTTIILALAAVACAGCSTTATLFPLEGEFAEQTPIPQIVATVNGITGNTGPITLTMPDGEVCSGKWSSGAAAGVSVSTGSLFTKYGSTYGTVTSVSSGSGQNPGVAVLTCDRGRLIEVEFVTGAGTATGFGFAEDNRGNVYRVLF